MQVPKPTLLSPGPTPIRQTLPEPNKPTRWTAGRYVADTATSNQEGPMATLFVRHDVEDFNRWKSGYDEARPIRDEKGVREHGIYQGADNPNDVTVYHVFDSVEAAQEFTSDPRLRDVMDQIGVTGEPQIWVTDEVERGS
jgi:quinol monooxygenase YgiN